MTPRLSTVLAGLTLGLTTLGTAYAEYPDRALRLVVPFAAGGANDLVARVYAEKMAADLGQAIVVENRPGASGAVAAQYVADTDPDGYTLLLGANAVLVVNPILRPELQYSGSDFAPVGIGAQAPIVLVTPTTPALADVEALVAHVRGKQGNANYASPGQGTQMHLMGELFKGQTNTEATHIPYKGSAPALTDVVSGQVDFMFDNVQSSLPLIQGGKLQALAVTGDQRLAALPNIPTMGEAGFPEVNAVSWFSIMVPADVPAERLDRLRNAMAKAMADPETADRLAAFGAMMPAVTPADSQGFIDNERERWTQVIADAGIKAEN